MVFQAILNIHLPFIFAIGAGINALLAGKRVYELVRGFSLSHIIYFLHCLLDCITCLLVFVSTYEGISRSTQGGCLLLTSFGLFWFVFSLRAWCNLYLAIYHYHRVLSPSLSDRKIKWHAYVASLLIAIISSLTSTLAAVYYFEYDLNYHYCGSVFDFESEIQPDRFILIRYLYIMNIALNYLLPISAVIWFYAELLESLIEYEAPSRVICRTREFILLDGYLLLWLCAPIHLLELIQIMHWRIEIPYGRIYTKLLTMTGASYSILYPIIHLIMTTQFTSPFIVLFQKIFRVYTHSYNY